MVLVKAPLCKGMLSNVASDKGLRDCLVNQAEITIPPSADKRLTPPFTQGRQK